MPSPTASETVRVMIVDDHEIVRRGIAEIIDRADGLEVVAEAGGQAEALRRAELVRPDVVLVDLQLPDGTGIELMHEMRETVPGALPIVLTSFDDDEAMLAALSQSAHGFLLKDSAPEEIVRAVLAAADGGTTISPTTASRLVAHHLRPARRGGRPDITGAEQEVLALLCEGYSNAEIAQRLVVAESTVKTHVSHLMKKYRAASRLKLVVAVHREREAAL